MGTTMTLEWHDSKAKLPKTGRDVVGYCAGTDEMSLGFRSDADTHPTKWLDFPYRVTHWAYINCWNIYNEPDGKDGE